GVYLRPVLASLVAALTPRPPAVQPWSVLHVSFGDAGHGSVTMARGTATTTFLTADGGRTWRPAFGEPSGISFVGRAHAVTVDLGSRGRLEISDDAGRTWSGAAQPVTLGSDAGPSLAGVAGGPFFLDAADGWWPAVGPGSAAPVLWRTTNGGRSWI